MRHVLFAPALLFFIIPSEAFAACPYGSGLGDGCPGIGGQEIMTWEQIKALSQTSGQNWTAGVNNDGHPPWNLPWEYGIGRLTSIASHIDPAALAMTSNGAGGFHLTAYPGCDYYNPASNHSTWNSTQQPANTVQVYCDNTSNDIRVSQWNLSAENGHNCVFIQYNNSSAHDLSFSDLYFDNDQNCGNAFAAGKAGALIYGRSNPNPMNFSVTDSTFHGEGQTLSVGGMPSTASATGSNVLGGQFSVLVVNGLGGSGSSKQGIFVRNYVDNWPGHVVNIGGYSNFRTAIINISDNVIWNTQQTAPQGHGDIPGNLGAAFYQILDNNMVICDNNCSNTITGMLTIQNCSTCGLANSITTRNLVVTNRLGGAASKEFTVSMHVTTSPGTLVIDSAGDNIGRGQGISGKNIFLDTNISGSGVGSVWQYDCGTNPSNSYTPLCSNSHGYYNIDPGVAIGTASFKMIAVPTNLAIWFGHGISLYGTIANNWIDTTGLQGSGPWLDASTVTCTNALVINGNTDLVNGGSPSSLNALVSHGVGGHC